MQSLTGENFGSPGFLGGVNIKGNLPGNLNASENLGISRKSTMFEGLVTRLTGRPTFSRSGDHVPWYDRIIISDTSKFKAIFDIVMLLLIAYSCFTSVF